MESHRHPSEKPHPSIVTYIFVGSVLAVVTAIEVAVFYWDVAGSILVSIFIVLSLFKFVLVIMFYMHLRYDHRLFSFFFVGGLLLAMGVTLGFIALFQNFDVGEADVAVAVPTPTPLPTSTPRPAPSPTPGGIVPPGEIDGSMVFIEKGCAACHTIEGLAGAVGTVGPELTHIVTVAEQRVSSLTAEEYIKQSIIDPGAFVVEGYGGLMPPAIRDIMIDKEFEALIDYLLTLE